MQVCIFEIGIYRSVYQSYVSDNPDGEEGNNESANDRQSPNMSLAENVTEDNSLHEKSPESKLDVSSIDEDEGKLCPICYEMWTNCGEHRTCTLKCGHTFGHSCLLRWLKSRLNGHGTCPSCKTKCRTQDICFLQVTSIVPAPTSEIDEIQMQVKKIYDQIDQEKESHQQFEREMKKREIELLHEIDFLNHTASQNRKLKTEYKPPDLSKVTSLTFDEERSLQVDSKGGCRVFAYEPQSETMVFSSCPPNEMWSGWGVRKLRMSDFLFTNFISAHSKPIRDFSLKSNKLLSVSLDCHAKLIDLHNNCELINITCDNPLWSGCWHLDHAYQLYLGESRGTVSLWDTRNVRESVTRFEVPEDGSPVVSVASARDNTLLCCKLNSCWSFECGDPAGKPLSSNLEGPFMSLRYEPNTDRILVSSRPNQRRPYTRHVLLRNGQSLVEIEGAPVQSKLTRPCLFSLQGQTLVAAYHETNSNIGMWHISGRQLASLPANSSILDLEHIYAHNKNYLCSLTESRLNFYHLLNIS